MQLAPESTFDCLFIARRIQRQLGSFTAQEVHLLAYLGCLLWLYSGRTIVEWGYPFVGTEFGAPFSQPLDSSFNELVNRSYVTRIEARFRLNEMAENAFSGLDALLIYQHRAECLQAACASTTAFSIGMVRTALANEPELRRARAMPVSRFLLEEAGQSEIYEQFQALHSALGNRSSDLRLPAFVWLSTLYRSTGAGEPSK